MSCHSEGAPLWCNVLRDQAVENPWRGTTIFRCWAASTVVSQGAALEAPTTCMEYAFQRAVDIIRPSL